MNSERKRGGRPRSDAARKKILAAALKIVGEKSIQAMTMDGVAAEAGISKATIYRWWDSKASVVIDAFIENHIVRTPIRHDIDPAESILNHWRSLAVQYSQLPGKIVAQIIATGQNDRAVLDEFRDRFYAGRVAALDIALQRLRQTYGHKTEADLGILTNLLYPTLYVRLLMGEPAIDEQFIEEYPLAVFALYGIRFDESGHVIQPDAARPEPKTGRKGASRRRSTPSLSTG